MIGNNHLSVAGGDGGDNKGGADQRASTASFGGIYDSYFDGRLSVIPDHDRSSTYSITSDGNDHNGQYRPSSIASTSTTSSFSFPAFRPDHRPQSGDTYQVRM